MQGMFYSQNHQTHELKENFLYHGESYQSKAHGNGKVSIPGIGFLEGEFTQGTLKSSWSLEIDEKKLRVDIGPHFPKWCDTILITNTHDLPSSSCKFSAEIKTNEGGATGKATINFSNNDSYEGSLKDWKYEGQGKYYWGKNSFYEGSWKNGLFHGFGKIVNEEIVVYEGDFHCGDFHGIGKCLLGKGWVFKHKSGWVYDQGSQNHWVYDGEWEKGHFYGIGLLLSPNNESFILSHDESGKLIFSRRTSLKSS
jgi:hypothetical protein